MTDAYTYSSRCTVALLLAVGSLLGQQERSFFSLHQQQAASISRRFNGEWTRTRTSTILVPYRTVRYLLRPRDQTRTAVRPALLAPAWLGPAGWLGTRLACARKMINPFRIRHVNLCIPWYPYPNQSNKWFMIPIYVLNVRVPDSTS